MRTLRVPRNLLPWCAAALLLPVRINAATEEELAEIKAQLKAEVQAEVKAVKGEYEERIKRLENRIGTLEADNARLKKEKSPAATNDTPEVASLQRRVKKLEQTSETPSSRVSTTAAQVNENGDAIERLEASLRADATETRDIYRDDAGWPFDATKLYDLPRPLEYHGYFRSGFGLNGEGGKMEAFKAPGAGAKFRLGNENDTYGEIGLTNNWLRQDDPLKSPYVRTTAMLSYSTAENFSYDSLNNQAQGNDIALRQAFVEAGNVITSLPDIKFWAGQRYYRRHDIHIDDFYFLDMSGYGGGVEDVPIGKGAKVALAWLGGSVDNYQTDHGNAAKSNIDFRLYEVGVLYGKAQLWLDYSHTRGGDVHDVFNPDGSQFGIQSSSGWAIGLIHRTEGENLWGGYNEFAIQYGSGAAYNFGSTLDLSGPDLDEAWRFRVLDDITIQPCANFAMQAVILHEETEFGGPHSHQRWTSLGARPVYFINDRFSLALEAGIDWAKSEPMGTDGHLWKITFAPQLSRGGKFFSRPVLRAFVTYAGWSEDFKGLVGGGAYANDTEGWSFGLQAEAWW